MITQSKKKQRLVIALVKEKTDERKGHVRVFTLRSPAKCLTDLLVYSRNTSTKPLNSFDRIPFVNLVCYESYFNYKLFTVHSYFLIVLSITYLLRNL